MWDPPTNSCESLCVARAAERSRWAYHARQLMACCLCVLHHPRVIWHTCGGVGYVGRAGRRVGGGAGCTVGACSEHAAGAGVGWYGALCPGAAWLLLQSRRGCLREEKARLQARGTCRLLRRSTCSQTWAWVRHWTPALMLLCDTPALAPGFKLPHMHKATASQRVICKLQSQKRVHAQPRHI